ncbi:MAG: hypothetical protein IJU45_02740, partial [Clostridia bacterium]|nr:hypothetical protein [Clostridia bacterium]
MQNNNGDFFDDIDDVLYDEEEMPQEEDSSQKRSAANLIYTQVYNLGDGFLYYSRRFFSRLIKLLIYP